MVYSIYACKKNKKEREKAKEREKERKREKREKEREREKKTFKKECAPEGDRLGKLHLATGLEPQTLKVSH